MKLHELEWVEAPEFGDSQGNLVDKVLLPSGAHFYRYNKGVDGYWAISATRESWYGMDELTAQAILFELTK